MCQKQNDSIIILTEIPRKIHVYSICCVLVLGYKSNNDLNALNKLFIRRLQSNFSKVGCTPNEQNCFELLETFCFKQLGPHFVLTEKQNQTRHFFFLHQSSRWILKNMSLFYRLNGNFLTTLKLMKINVKFGRIE